MLRHLADTETANGFANRILYLVVKKRWVVERTFAWLSQNRRMSKDYEWLCSTSESFVYAAMSRLMVRRLTSS